MKYHIISIIIFSTIGVTNIISFEKIEKSDREICCGHAEEMAQKEALRMLEDPKLTLFDAVDSNNIYAVRAFLHRGDKVDQRNEQDITPLYRALYNNRIEILKELLKHGADVNIVHQYKNPPLFFAIINEDVATTQLLLDYGVKVNITNKDGSQPLHFAVSRNSPAMVKSLLKAGADVNKISDHWGTPLDKAIRDNHDSIIKLLLEAGAERSKIEAVSQGIQTLIDQHNVNRRDAIHKELPLSIPNAIGNLIGEYLNLPPNTGHITKFSLFGQLLSKKSSINSKKLKEVLLFGINTSNIIKVEIALEDGAKVTEDLIKAAQRRKIELLNPNTAQSSTDIQNANKIFTLLKKHKS